MFVDSSILIKYDNYTNIYFILMFDLKSRDVTIGFDFIFGKKKCEKSPPYHISIKE